MNQELWESTVTMVTNSPGHLPIAALRGWWNFIPAGAAIASTLHQPGRSWERISEV